jgi:hypothetical protein
LSIGEDAFIAFRFRNAGEFGLEFLSQ